MTEICVRTTGDVVAEVKMSMTAFRGTHLLVEGGTDSRFWKLQLSQPASCQLVICGCKTVVVSSINEFDRMAIGNVLGIIDDDFDSILGISYASKNLHATDTHDLETMMINSGALNSVLIEYGDAVKISQFEARVGTRTVNAIANNALVFGRLRLLNARNHWNVDFTRFSPWKYVSQTTWQVDTTSLFNDFANLVGTSSINIKNAVDAEISTPVWNIVQGHDAINILAIGLRTALASQQVSEKDVTRALRLSYNSTMLHRTALYSKLAAWSAGRGAAII